MTEGQLKPMLEKLGLRQSEFARLLNVTPRAVNMWATGAQPVPGYAMAYLRLLEAAEPAARDAEFGRLAEGLAPLSEGIYGVSYTCETSGESGRGLVVLRAGKLTGSDIEGNLFCGTYRFDRAKGTNLVELQLGTQEHESAQASESDALRTSFTISRAKPVATFTIGRHTYEIELRFLGTLPK